MLKCVVTSKEFCIQSSTMISNRLDLVVFGASGFTGKHVVQELTRICAKYPEVAWAVAGRNKEKLEHAISDVSKKSGADLSQIKIIVADVNDKESLTAMCSQAKVLINCCGPFVKYGQSVVSAAVACKTHYIDVSGEKQFIESVEQDYNQLAKDANVFIINACGLSSIPADLGVLFLEKHFGGTLNSVESYLITHFPCKMWIHCLRYGIIRYSSWESLINSLSNTSLSKLKEEPSVQLEPALEQRFIVHKNVNRWSIPFPGADPFVVTRTQRHLLSLEGKRPTQYKSYLTFPCVITAVATIFGVFFLFILSKLSFTRTILLKYPRLCTFGAVTYGDPKEGAMDDSTFQYEMIGKGWDQNTDVSNKMNKSVVARISVTGVNPAYIGTAKAVIFSALTLLKEQDKIPSTGGVLTAGVAFRNTDILKHLQENDIKFQIIECNNKV